MTPGLLGRERDFGSQGSDLFFKAGQPKHDDVGEQEITRGPWSISTRASSASAAGIAR
jgi:hypothetical protein